jgi:hypothetical protein
MRLPGIRDGRRRLGELMALSARPLTAWSPKTLAGGVAAVPLNLPAVLSRRARDRGTLTGRSNERSALSRHLPPRGDGGSRWDQVASKSRPHRDEQGRLR